MENFVIGIDYDQQNFNYRAALADGQVIELDAESYEDAVLEADTLDLEQYA
jgi:hypothetical protein